MSQLMRAFRSGEYSSPKTVLGFFGILTTILVGAAIGGTLVLSGERSLHVLIPLIWGFVGLVVLILVVVTIVAMWKDPTHLMLGRVTGREYLELQRLTQGDSQRGERVEEGGPSTPTISLGTEPLPSGDTPKTQDQNR